MRVLWFSPVPLPPVCRELNFPVNYGAWWVWSLLSHLAGRDGLDLAVAWAHPSVRTRRCFSRDGVRYYVIPEVGRFIRSTGRLRRLDDEFNLFLGIGRDRRALSETLATVEDYLPDLVHVFGAENYHGLAAPLIRPPLVVWIQGILDVYRQHFFGGMTFKERLRHPRLLCRYYRMVLNAAREREIYRGCHYFIGRTGWDAAHQARLQPQGRYYAVQDCLRPEFYTSAPWQREAAGAMTVYTTTSASLLKGTDVLVRAISLLRSRFSDVRLRVAGLMPAADSVVRRLNRLTADLRLSGQVEFVGQLDGRQIVQELHNARVFVLPSFIENNPNSLAEAQLVGTPVVAAFSGGVSDMVADRETGLLYRASDSATLARQIDGVLTNDDLAARLSIRARQVAHLRHSPQRIVDALLVAYDAMLKSSRLSAS